MDRIRIAGGRRLNGSIPISGAKNWASGYMPATYQGNILRSAGAPVPATTASGPGAAHTSATR